MRALIARAASTLPDVSSVVNIMACATFIFLFLGYIDADWTLFVIAGIAFATCIVNAMEARRGYRHGGPFRISTMISLMYATLFVGVMGFAIMFPQRHTAYEEYETYEVECGVTCLASNETRRSGGSFISPRSYASDKKAGVECIHA